MIISSDTDIPETLQLICELCKEEIRPFYRSGIGLQTKEYIDEEDSILIKWICEPCLWKRLLPNIVLSIPKELFTDKEKLKNILNAPDGAIMPVNDITDSIPVSRQDLEDLLSDKAL